MVFICYDSKQGVALLPELFSGFKAFIDMKEHHGWISLFGYPRNTLYSPLILSLFTKCCLKWQTQCPIYNMSAGWDLYSNMRRCRLLFMHFIAMSHVKNVSGLLVRCWSEGSHEDQMQSQLRTHAWVRLCCVFAAKYPQGWWHVKLSPMSAPA